MESSSDRTSKLAQLLARLVAVNSVFPNELAVASLIAEYLRGYGLTVKQIPTPGKTNGAERPNLVAYTSVGPGTLGFYGHMDTVPPDPRFEVDPFCLRVDGNIARGLGSADMKGGLSAMLLAAEYAEKQRIPATFVFGVDEEDISRGAHALVASAALSHLRALIVAESGQVEDLNAAFSACIGRKGRLLFDVEIHGKTAHAALSHTATNAIEKAARFVSALSALSWPQHSALGTSTIIIQRIASECDSFSVPAVCSVQFSALTTPLVSSALILARVEELCQKEHILANCKLHARETPYAEAYELDVNSDFYKFVQREILAPAGVSARYTASVADENVFAHGLSIPVLTIGPIGAGDHTKDEWVNVTSLVRVVEAYSQMLHASAAGQLFD